MILERRESIIGIDYMSRLNFGLGDLYSDKGVCPIWGSHFLAGFDYGFHWFRLRLGVFFTPGYPTSGNGQALPASTSDLTQG
jgi:hypothetical protein